MNITGTTVVFKSAEPYYSLEATGAKPNTVRVVTEQELIRLTNVTTIEIEKSPSVGELFVCRRITGLFDITEGMAASGIKVDPYQRIIVICWAVA